MAKLVSYRLLKLKAFVASLRSMGLRGPRGPVGALSRTKKKSSINVNLRSVGKIKVGVK